jgi:glycosyltransferase involved in cell wall biosynthesis
MLGAARKVFVPNADVLDRISRYYPTIPLVLRVHPETFDDAPILYESRAEGERVRVAIIGAISLIKGSQVLVDALKDVKARNLPIDYILIGHSDHPDLNAGMPHFTMTGQYREDEIGALLETYRPHLAFIPSVWPETYCYTLSIAWRFGIRPAAFDMGAPAQRIRALGGENAGEILPVAWSKDVAKLNDAFAAYISPSDSVVRPVNVSYPSLMQDYYGLDTAASIYHYPKVRGIVN